MTTPTDPAPASDYHDGLRRDALTPPGLPKSDSDAEALALGRAIRLIEEAHAQYSKARMTRPFFEFVRIVLTTKEEK